MLSCAHADFFATVSVRPGRDELAALASRVSAVPGCEKYKGHAVKQWFRSARYRRITQCAVLKKDRVGDDDGQTGTEQTPVAPVETVSGK